jgi:hypothetical protein
MSEKRTEQGIKNNHEREVFAIEIREFIKTYTPRFWVVPISDIDFVPHFTYQEIDQIFSGEIPERFTKWYLKEAIQDFVKNLAQ